MSKSSPGTSARERRTTGTRARERRTIGTGVRERRAIAILGAGSMASALALNLARHKRPVRMYCIEEDVEKEMRGRGCNTKYLPGHPFPKHVTATSDIASVLQGADAVFLAVPSHAVKEVLTLAAPHLERNAVFASITKGLDPKTLEPLILAEAALLPASVRKGVCTIGGPAVAQEMAKGSPTGLVIAGKNRNARTTIKRLLETDAVKCQTASDVLGVGLASALKNPYAIALGLCDGLKLPTNAKALVLTLALDEIRIFLKASGADPKTASGLAGLGDLFVTGMSPHGRNRTYGERLVGAKTADPKRLRLTTVEGIAATEQGVRLGRRLRVKAPLLTAIGACLKQSRQFERPFVEYLRKLRLA